MSFPAGDRAPIVHPASPTILCQAARASVAIVLVCVAAEAVTASPGSGGRAPSAGAPRVDDQPAPGASPAPPVAVATRATGAIILDGVLDEADWRLAPALSSFTQRLPAEGEPATQAAEVRILYDDERLLIGAELFDSEPGRIIAREMKEDAQLGNDDSFGVLLDTFQDRRNAFYFQTNPNGARADALIYDEGRTTSFDWDGVWEVRSRVTDRGWSVEMEIPFKTLYFPPGADRAWGLQLWRGIRRNAEDVYWAPIPRNEDLFRVSRAGELRGLNGIRQGSRLAVKPYALGEAARRPTLGESDAELSGEVGADLRYAVTPNLAAVLTVNTDFAETEVDEQQVNITRFPLFFPEKREFFLESTGYFDFGFRGRGPGQEIGIIPFFSRRIGLDPATNTPIPIQAGVKMAGRVGRTNLGLLTINTDAEGDSRQTNYSVLRVSQDFLTRSNWGVIGVSAEPSGADDPFDPADPFGGTHSNRTYGADLNFSVLDNLKFGGSILRTRTPGVEGGESAGHAYANWSDNAWQVEFTYREIGEFFNPEAGFVQRTGIEGPAGALGWSWRSSTAPVRRVAPHVRASYTADQDHTLATRREHWATTVEFRDGSEVELAWNPIFDEVQESFSLDDGVEIRPGAYHLDQWFFLWEDDPSRVISGSLFAEGGDFFDGRFWTANLGANARFSRHVRSGLKATRTEIDLPSRAADPGDPAVPALPPAEFDFSLIEARIGVTFTTRMSFDTFLQYNTAVDDLSANLRFNFKYRPGSDIYVVYNERRDEEGLPTDVADRSFTVKWTYLFSF